MLVQMMLSPILSLLLVLRLSTRFLSPMLESMCQLEIKPGWQCGQQWRPHSLGWGLGTPLARQRLFLLWFHVLGELYRCGIVLQPETGPSIAF